MSDDLHKLNSALRSIKKIENYSSEMDFDKFSKSDVIVDAVFMQFINLGERIGALSHEFKINYSELPYHKAKALRNVISHQYDGMNLKTVWNTIKSDLPPLKDQITNIINEFDN